MTNGTFSLWSRLTKSTIMRLVLFFLPLKCFSHLNTFGMKTLNKKGETERILVVIVE